VILKITDKYQKGKIMHSYVLLGFTYAGAENVSVEFKLNDQLIFSGEVPTTDLLNYQRDVKSMELCTWNSESALTGEVTISLIPKNGNLVFSLLGEKVMGSDNESDNKESIIELEYPNNLLTNHAVSNVRIDNVLQPVPVNYDKLDTPNDIRGWDYKIPENSVFTCSYYTGPFDDIN